jgi:uncharacterized spore protein YtfJ
MDQTPNVNQNLSSLFSNLEGFTQNEGLIGKPVTQGDKTFLPVVSVTLGYGSGNSASKPEQENSNHGLSSMLSATHMAGGALGLGARLSTDAVIVIDKDSVSMMPLNATANAGQLMDKIPQILSNMGLNKQQSQQQGEQQQGPKQS